MTGFNMPLLLFALAKYKLAESISVGMPEAARVRNQITPVSPTIWQ